MPSSEIIGWFADIDLSDRPTVGGKGGSLGELTRASIPVPPGFVVRTAAFERFLNALEKEEPIRSKVEALGSHELDKILALSQELRARLERAPLPDDVNSEILAAYVELCGKDNNPPLAVRSSATTEDAADASFAGLQDTYLWTIGARATLRSVRSCWASLYSTPSITYRRKRGLPESSVAMAVVIQGMVKAQKAGVMFTRSPLTGDRSVVTIEGAWGLGSAVVSGEVTPDRWVIAKITGEISVREISDKHVQHLPAPGGGVEEAETPEDLRRVPCLSDAEIAALKDIAKRVERHYGRPQDIEWAIDQTGEIRLLQSRPETVWSSKGRAPVAKPAENPLQHVMKIFGGRR
ncbi:MAG TPA: PEP/pyruvate-binding domain-containing protein [Candidatus Aquilonibacter sp.]|nr:PEP/pyruvate-binding domain-containing protein [Candidatus Aquilonibacter sp.]